MKFSITNRSTYFTASTTRARLLKETGGGMDSLLHRYIAQTLTHHTLDITWCANNLGISKNDIMQVIDDLTCSHMPIEVEKDTAQLRTTDPITEIIDDKFLHIHLPMTTSVQDIALGMEPRNDKTLLISTDYQMYGRGQYSNKWLGHYGQNILISMMVPQKKNIVSLSVLLGSITRTWLAHQYNLPHLMVKWPNDIMLNGLKLCGILIEVHPSQKHWVIGIGLNVYHTPDAQKYVSQPIIALDEAVEGPLRRQDIIQGLAHAIHDIFHHQETLSVIQEKTKAEYNLYDFFQNKQIQAIENKEKICGIGRGINESGHYLMELGDGSIHTIASASIRLYTNIL